MTDLELANALREVLGELSAERIAESGEQLAKPFDDRDHFREHRLHVANSKVLDALDALLTENPALLDA